MASPPPYYNQQPNGYNPQSGHAYPQGQYPPQGYPSGPYPQQGYPGGQYPSQPQVVYVDRPQPQQQSRDTGCLTALAMLLCGCCLGEALCDHPCLCLYIPCPIRLPWR